MKQSDRFVGIDISKDNFDVCVLSQEALLEEGRFNNDAQGWQKFAKNLSDRDLCIIEATGSYHVGLALYLVEHDKRVSVVNPLRVKYFSRLNLKRAKTDRVDAYVIAQYGQVFKPESWTAPPTHLRQLQQLMTVSAQLTKQKTALINQQKNFELVPDPSKEALEIIKWQIVKLEEHLQEIQCLINNSIKEHYKELEASLGSIPGLGPKTVATLILVTGGFTKFESYKALIAYVGLAPRTYESGVSVKGASHICKLGSSYLRKLLYQCALSAKRFNPACKELFERLYIEKKKPFKVAMIAVANKLLKIAFTIATTGQKFDPEYRMKYQLAK